MVSNETGPSVWRSKAGGESGVSDIVGVIHLDPSNTYDSEITGTDMVLLNPHQVQPSRKVARKETTRCIHAKLQRVDSTVHSLHIRVSRSMTERLVSITSARFTRLYDACMSPSTRRNRVKDHHSTLTLLYLFHSTSDSLFSPLHRLSILSFRISNTLHPHRF